MSAARPSAARSSLLNACAWGAALLQGLAVSAVVVRTVGAGAWGVWATVAAFRGYVLFLDGGIATGITRDAALEEKEGAAARLRIRAAWRVEAVLAVLLLAATLLLAPRIDSFLPLSAVGPDEARSVALLLGAEAAVALLAGPLAAILRGKERFGALAALAGGQTVVALSLLAVLVPSHGIVGAAAAALVGRVAAAGATFLWMRAKGLLPGGRGEGAAGPAIPLVLRFAGPLWLAAVGTQIGLRTDVPIVGALFGDEAAGHYELGLQMPGTALGLLFAILGFSLPRFAAADDERMRALSGPLFFLACFLGAAGFGFLAVHASDLLHVWVGRAPPLAVSVSVLYCGSWACNAFANVLASLAIAKARHGILVPLVLTEAAANFVLSLVLARTGRADGPALATLLTIAVSNLVVLPVLLVPRLGIPWRTVLRPSVTGYGLGLAVAALVAFAADAVGGTPALRLAVGIALTGALAAAVLDLTVRSQSDIRRILVLTKRGGWAVLRRQREEVRAARARIEKDRAEAPIVWSKERPPLVTVRIATYNRGRLVAERAIATALAQTHPAVEVVVVGDRCDEATEAAVLSVKDPRVRFENLPERGRYPENAVHRWMVAGCAPAVRGIEMARGEWIAPLDDDDEFTPDHVATLLDAARTRDLEFVWGVSLMQERDGTWTPRGAWPPAQGSIVHPAVMYHRRLASLVYDVESWKVDEPADWNLWRRMRDAGARMGFVDRVVCRHYVEARDVKVTVPPWLG